MRKKSYEKAEQKKEKKKREKAIPQGEERIPMKENQN